MPRNYWKCSKEVPILMMMKDDQSTEEVSQNDITLTMPILSPRYDEYQRDNGNRANIDYNG